MKLLVYELNEVPWRVIDKYIELKPNSELRTFLDCSAQLTTHTSDSGELHPWTTWPTMHRGVTNDTHKIQYLNQDLTPSSNYPPFWEILAREQKSVGIFGPLQSYPVFRHERVAFHIPDTFSAGSETCPPKYQAFQSFNLKQTQRDQAISEKIKLSDAVNPIGLFRAGIRPISIAKIVKHLASEQLNALNKTRRAQLQAVLSFDVFKNCLKESKPDYVSFFSNHVAGMMHRYWKYLFPEDFGYSLSLDNPHDAFHTNSIISAMDLFDSQLKWLRDFCTKHDYDLILCSSMGQEAIERGEYISEVKVENHEALFSTLGYSKPARISLAMQPDLVFEFDNPKDAALLLSKLESITDTAGDQIFKLRYPAVGNTLNLTVIGTPCLSQDETLVYEGSRFQTNEMGVSLFDRDIGTGYHQPEGTLIWNGEHAPNLPHRAIVDSRQFAPTILEALGVGSESYMKPSLFSEATDQPIALQGTN